MFILNECNNKRTFASSIVSLWCFLRDIPVFGGFCQLDAFEAQNDSAR